MAKLIKCSDCGKKISANANACPNCGAPARYSAELDRINADARSTRWAYIIGVFSILLGLLAFSAGIFPALLLIIGGLLALPFVRNGLIERNFSSTNKPLVIVSAVLIIFGVISYKDKAESKHLEYIAENPEAYAAEQEAKLQRKVEEDLARKDKLEANRKTDSGKLTNCQVNVKNSLKDPSSFKMDYGSTQTSNTVDGSVISFKFSGTNSFNATITSIANCTFDNDARLTGISTT